MLADRRTEAMAAWITSWRVSDKHTMVHEACSRSAWILGDTGLHSWEVLADILKSEEARDIVCDIGMFVSSSLRPSVYAR